MINTITEYIKHIPLDAYSMGQKSSHQNSKYWGVQIPDSARKCHIGLLEHFFGTSKEVFKSWTFKTNMTLPSTVWYLHSPILGILMQTLLTHTIGIQWDVFDVLRDGIDHVMINPMVIYWLIIDASLLCLYQRHYWRDWYKLFSAIL